MLQEECTNFFLVHKQWRMKYFRPERQTIFKHTVYCNIFSCREQHGVPDPGWQLAVLLFAIPVLGWRNLRQSIHTNNIFIISFNFLFICLAHFIIWSNSFIAILRQTLNMYTMYSIRNKSTKIINRTSSDKIPVAIKWIYSLFLY